MSNINLTEARNYLSELLPQAGETLKKYFISRVFTQKSKGGVDFATQADDEVDTFLLTSLKKRYPQTNFLTEETAPKNYSHLKELNNLWVIDPLDGTINFSRYQPNFAISVGLVDRGVSKLGVVYCPMTMDLYWAQADKKGAFFNGSLMHVSSTKIMGEAVIACDWAWGLDKRINVVRWLSLISTHVRQIKSMGSAVSDLASLANGRIDAYIHSGLKPWDVAAAALFIKKAGGKITTPTGAKWDIFHQDMLVSNGTLHAKILDLINEKVKK